MQVCLAQEPIFSSLVCVLMLALDKSPLKKEKKWVPYIQPFIQNY